MDKIDIFLERHKEQNCKEEIKTTITKNLNTSKSIKLNLKLKLSHKKRKEKHLSGPVASVMDFVKNLRKNEYQFYTNSFKIYGKGEHFPIHFMRTILI